MNLLAKLEKTKIFWGIFVLCLVFFFLRLPSLIEPYWYGDEGVYETIGLAINHGRLLYQGIWDNKPPLIYVTYALLHADQPAVKLLSLIVGLLSLVVFFLLAQRILKNQRVSIGITFLFLLLLGTPILEGNIANAEDFTMLPVLIAGFLIYHLSNQTHTKIDKSKLSSIFNSKSLLFISGLLLGIAFLYKIVAIFDFAAFFLFFNLINLPENLFFSFYKKHYTEQLEKINHKIWAKHLITHSFILFLGFLIPITMTIIYFAFNNALPIFFQSVFLGNINYVGYENTFLGISQGLLLLKALILILLLIIIIWKRKKFAKQTLFIFLWLIFSLFNIYFSGRPYTHYVIELLPSFCLLISLLFVNQSTKKRIGFLLLLVIVYSIVALQFSFNVRNTYSYYQNALTFLTGEESVEAYQSFFDPHVSRDYSLATFIKNNTSASQNVFIWGNNPQIYALSNKIPPGKYTVAYHIIQNSAFKQTQQVLIQTKPQYIIVLKETQPLPFELPLYIMRYNLPGATIYERSI